MFLNFLFYLKEWRLFLVRGQERNETYLKEIECSWKNLRSQGVFVLCRRGISFN